MHLYKYASFEVGHRILSTGKLRWATPKTLNDPFDMQFAFQMRIHRPQARAMALNKAWEHHYGPFRDKPLNALGLLIRATRGKFPQLTRDEFDREIGAGIDESIDTIEKQLETFAEKIRSHVAYDKIFCVSASASNILMWSYYAQNHSGVVLRFTTETPENPLRLARAVTYIDQVPALFDDDLLSDMLAGYEVMDQRRILNEVVWSKSSHWAHEEEWRVYAGAGRTNKDFEDVPFNPLELDGVVLGVRTDFQSTARIKELIDAKYPHVELLQAKLRQSEYIIDIERAS